MSNRVEYTITCTPIENVETERSGTRPMVATEVGKRLTAKGRAEVTDFIGSPSVNGFQNGQRSVKPIFFFTDVLVSAETTASFVYLKNVGVSGGGESNDLFAIKVMANTVLIAMLNYGEVMVLKDDNRGINCTDIAMRTVKCDGTPGTGTMYLEYLVVD